MAMIRRMRPDDVDGVMAIEEVVMEFPWTHSIFSDCIKVGYSCWVIAEEDPTKPALPTDPIELRMPKIIGYGLLSMAAEEAHVLNLCVTPERQRQGLGREMMIHLLEQAKILNAKSVYLEVRVSNPGAYDLYQKLGFTVIGHRKDYYPAKDGREDALVLEKKL